VGKFERGGAVPSYNLFEAKSAQVLKRTLFAALQLSQLAKKSGDPRALLSGQLLIDCSKHKKNVG
jgi:hypothetical protein